MTETMELSEAAEELLAAVWLAREQGAEEPMPRDSLAAWSDEAARELCQAGLLESSGDGVAFTPPGETQAASVIRRERLAERLLADVLNVSDPVAAEVACKFEHVLRTGLDDNICTLLGHPKACPHGSPIPRGPCCQEGAVAAARAVSSLADLAPGQSGVIAYLHSRRDLVQRLLAMGIVPGARIELLQNAPSYVAQLGNTQMALDRETAADIYVRLTGPSPRPPGRQRRLRFGLRRGRNAG